MNADDRFVLNRFIEAHEWNYATALAELKRGKKAAHWIWFIFPQIDGLGFSYQSKKYSIKSIDEARAYLSHPILGPRIRECVDAVLGINGKSAYDIFGSPDDVKLRSSMTLFDVIEPDSVFARVLDRYFDGQRDKKTLDLLTHAG